MERDGSEKRKRSHQEHRVPSSASSSSASSTNSQPEKKCVTDDSLTNQQTVVKKPTNAQVQLEFCQAVGRPDSKMVECEHDSFRSIPNTILVRKTVTASHVLLIGTTSCMLDPLRCPYVEQKSCSDVCKAFRAADPQFMKSHLEGHHQMRNVLINLVCPCPPTWHKEKKSCSVVTFDPCGSILRDHLMRFHTTFYEHVQQALYDGMVDDVHMMKRTKFPSWTNTERLLPSQIIPHRILFPSIIKDGEVQFICNIGACQQRAFSHPANLHFHVYREHRHRFGSQTQMFLACPIQDCPVEAYANSATIISHVAAMHPEAVGRRFSSEVKEKCAKYLGLVVGNCVGLAVTNTVQTDDGTAGSKPRSLEVYYCPVENCREFFLEEKDYLIWHILDCHALQWSLSTSADR